VSITTTFVALYSDSYTLPEAHSPAFPVIGDSSPVLAAAAADTSSTLSVSVNEEMLLEGLATLSFKAVRAFRKGPRKGSGLTLLTSLLSEDLIQKLEAAEAIVKRNHLNLFKYGDPIGDSDDDFGEPHGRDQKDRRDSSGAKQNTAAAVATNVASNKLMGTPTGKKK